MVDFFLAELKLVQMIASMTLRMMIRREFRSQVDDLCTGVEEG